MANAVAESLHNLTLAIDRLKTAIMHCDEARAKVSPDRGLVSFAAELCADSEFHDFDSYIHAMDRMAADARRRARLIDQARFLVESEPAKSQ